MRIRTATWAGALALVMASTVTTTGCFARYMPCGPEGDRPAGLTAEDLTGTYRGHPMGSLTLKGDGTFTVTDWPDFASRNRLADWPDPEIKLLSRKGTWRLAPKRDDVERDITFTFDDGDSHSGYNSPSYDIAGSKDDPRIYDIVGDPDVCDFHTFERDGD
ncbi:hypothetical protein AB0B50_32245 [Streptomyces sp. NPDC041068]|uniref:hypothetical protein n=1 Tax=Streptomyces sp. NPDC041068 TaxID=3155130 RepID=UPI0033D01DC0